MLLRKKRTQGFSLVELAVVVIIIGVLAAFGVPRFRDSVERSKASEAFNYLSSVRSAQERYHSLRGTYATAVSDLDVDLPTPKYFTVGTVTDAADLSGTDEIESGWGLVLTRSGPSAGYGNYTVTFTLNGYLNDTSTATSIAHSSRGSINPMAN